VHVRCRDCSAVARGRRGSTREKEWKNRGIRDKPDVAGAVLVHVAPAGQVVRPVDLSERLDDPVHRQKELSEGAEVG
jgi:hypothetical protein